MGCSVREEWFATDVINLLWNCLCFVVFLNLHYNITVECSDTCEAVVSVHVYCNIN